MSCIDVSVAFLQAEEYGEDEMKRYVSLTAYRGARKHYFQLLGPTYGQRSAPRAWYNTLSKWLVDEMGYIQSQNDTCVYYHPDTRHTVVVWVDFLCVWI